ncbi:type II secretion system protein M [Aliivibrio fischeri]|uniref:type II secretion system protein M n=1 Tax=Aliivibrio fischeri TaxID=668 RepID=UPI001F2A9C1A|nr:type II secretion system protein M [Aliivibrio fischeri]MCE7537611.1 type II secretion system protein M [Aliivibrio fischeri]MCE7560205.1 type II secretion system protein M [Aliivibrio fischeri]
MKAFMAWWQSISPRERILVAGGGVALLIAVIYWGGIKPLNDRAELAQNRINNERNLLAWVQKKADTIIALRGGASSSSQSAIRPMNQVIPSSTRQFKIELIRMQPRGEQMQVWVKPLPFNSLVNWLAFLRDSQGINVQFLDLNKTDVEGVVEVNRLQLTREAS